MKKVKVLYIEEAIDFGGSLIVLASMANYCSDKVEPFVNLEIGDFSEVSEKSKISLIKHKVTYADIIRLKNSFFEKFKGRFSRRLISLMLDSYRIFGNLSYIWKLCRLIKKEGIEIVHLNNALGNAEANIVCLLSDVKTLVHFHGGSEPGRIAKKLISRPTTFYLSISEYIADRMRKYGLSDKSIRVLHNPYFERARDIAPSELIELKERHGIAENTLLLGIVGRIVDWKGQLETVRAFDLVKRQIPNAKLLIVGGASDGVDDYYEQLLTEIKEKNLEKDVIITGYQKEVDHYYELIDVCVHASTLPEPFGLVIIEGMAKGKPVIAANTGATKEIVDEGVNGFLVDVFNQKVFAERMMELLTSETLRTRFGKNGKEKVQQKFNIENYIVELEKMYFDILK